MPGRTGWSDGLAETAPPPAEMSAGSDERRAAARTVAAASTGSEDLRELLAMLGLDDVVQTGRIRASDDDPGPDVPAPRRAQG